MPQWAVGVDLGGTNIRAAGVDPDGLVGAVVSEPVDWQVPAQTPFLQLVSVISRVLQGRSDAPEAIGLGVTGPIDPDTGIIDNLFTLPPSLQGDARGALERAFSLPVVFENDANVAAVAETRFGSALGRSVVVCLTVGTGVGVGVVHNGRIHRGSGNTHPEAGHACIDPAGPLCYCGISGCLESLASGRAVLAAGIAAGVVGADGSAREVHEAAARGDASAVTIVERAQRMLALGARNLIAVHAADTVVLAGNALGEAARLIEVVQSEVDSYPFAPKGGVLVTESSLRGLAGCVGAAALAFAQ